MIHFLFDIGMVFSNVFFSSFSCSDESIFMFNEDRTQNEPLPSVIAIKIDSGVSIDNHAGAWFNIWVPDEERVSWRVKHYSSELNPNIYIRWFTR